MDSQLKALKVAELKRILTDAGVPVTARATKADLIARILNSQDAQRVYRTLHGPLPDSEPAQKQEPLPPPTPAPAVVPDPVPVPALSPSSPSSAQQPANPLSLEDLELEKRKARAVRFGIPLVQPATAKGSVPDDPGKLEARAARFGINNSMKRSTPDSPPVDPEELEKRRKRAERFATKAPDASS